MRVLWIATKTPWPTIDGGRLVQWSTLRALSAHGIEVSLVAPVSKASRDAARERLAEVCTPSLVERIVMPEMLWTPSWLWAPLSVARHSQPAVRHRVEALVARERFDVVHVEQLQALPQAATIAAKVPLVLRAQNVESDLWRRAARRIRFARPLALLEARRLARWEGVAVRRVATTVALTRPDAQRLAELAGGEARIVRVAAPFPSRLPQGDAPLAGSPAIVLLGHRRWFPNRDAQRWFVGQLWPAIRARLGGAVLHVFGGEPVRDPAVVVHPAPEDAALAFAPGSLLAVPLQVASGVRMKILEAWARSVPVVASPRAVAGLDAEHGRHLLVAEDPEGFATAFERLAVDEELRRRIVSEGRSYLAREHDPSLVAARLVEVYEEAARDPGARSGS